MELKSQLENADQVCMRCQKELIESPWIKILWRPEQTTSPWHSDKIFVTNWQKSQTSHMFLSQNHDAESFRLLDCHFS